MARQITNFRVRSLPIGDVHARTPTGLRQCPRGLTGSVVIMAGGDRSKLEAIFGEVKTAGHIASPYAMGCENDLPVYVLRQPRKPLDEIWPTLKVYD